ncbi:universal stress protein [Bosea sp. (in: a-proteobacteria)]|uniref:universal stress protein n=1 Tax=Bosea sp. (in: a-proteobacteria) TaxID=1871050 RepID=UPI0026161099|nr:universal stress protein [Bosea sp. (in: a-proteobacteria)]MCO5090957.1 universal stress protein [Bosea sp. (in: a-proteobacteria)]
MNVIKPSSSTVTTAQAVRGAAYRDIAVHLDGSPEDEVRLAHAEALAERHGARITGIFTNPLPDPALFAGDFGISAIGQLVDSATEEGDAAEKRLRQRLARLGPPHELRRLDAFPGILERAVATEARWNDLFIATCPRDDAHSHWRPLIENVMFDGGRGLYLLPPKAALRSPIKTVLIGWTDTRQSARAVAEALPLIAQATQVHLVTVREEAHGRMGGAEALADISAHLARHGVEATATILDTQTSASDALLAEARRISADLIVAGAYGHSRFREWVLGGVTADLLDSAPVPLFLAQ